MSIGTFSLTVLPVGEVLGSLGFSVNLALNCPYERILALFAVIILTFPLYRGAFFFVVRPSGSYKGSIVEGAVLLLPSVGLHVFAFVILREKDSHKEVLYRENGGLLLLSIAGIIYAKVIIVSLMAIFILKSAGISVVSFALNGKDVLET